MPSVAVRIATLLVLLAASSAAIPGPAEDRATHFLRNAHTGVSMDSSEWLTERMRGRNMFTGFGGLRALIESSTRLAIEYGGLKEVKLLHSERTKSKTDVVTLEVVFFRDPRNDPKAPLALKEPQIWNIKVRREAGALKLEF